MSDVVQQARVSENYARKLTENIRRTAINAKEDIDKLNELIAQAKNGNAHLVLVGRGWCSTHYAAQRNREKRGAVGS